MKKSTILAGLALAAMIPSLVSAQGSGAVPDQIKALLAQIQALQQQMANLQAQKAQVALQLATTLREGSQGENVTVLQALLAADSSLYPEGLITGFYGKATARAVKRFQEKHGLEGVGFVGPRTISRSKTTMILRKLRRS
jgi:peptidoglycan hydrolase-like protein with peptidoglycan-binding domain